VVALATVGFLAVLAGGCSGQILETNSTPEANDSGPPGTGATSQANDSGPPGTGASSKASVDDGGPLEADARPDASHAAPDGAIGAPTNHRPDDSQCQASRPAGNCSAVGTRYTLSCSSDSDCTDGGANGRCTNNGGGPAGCFCAYDACTTDVDCAAGQLCVCHDSAYAFGGSTCMPGNCRVDADCGAGGYCSPSQGPTGCGLVTGYYCHTAKDRCTNDSDCSGWPCPRSSSDSRWECAPHETPIDCPV
jgi:hypothetical protein